MRTDACPTAKATRGFTLVEMIVAISILALVAVMGWRGLDSIVRARVAISTDMEQTRSLQLSFAQLQHDCALLAPPELIGARPALLVSQGRLLLIRQVFVEQQATRLQVIVYRVRNGMLLRQESAATRDLALLNTYWQTASRDAESGMTDVVLQSEIAGIQMRLWDKDARTWRAAESGLEPGMVNWSGLEMSLQLHGYRGPVAKTFLLGAA